MQSRFESNDQEILCGLGDVVLNEHPSDKSFEVVALNFTKLIKNFLKLNRACIKTRQQGYQLSSKNRCRDCRKNVSRWIM